MSRLLITALSAAALVLTAGCGGDEGTGGVDGITVTKSATPKVTVQKGLKTQDTEIKVVEEGSGDAVTEGDTVKVNYLAVNARTGKQFDSSYAAGRSTTITLQKSNILPGFVKALDGQKVGSRILAVLSPSDGFGARSELDIKADDTVVLVFDLVAKLPTAASGKSEKLPAALPQLELDSHGTPEGFVSDAGTEPAPREESAHVVVQGAGPTIEANQDVSAHYLGQVYPSGKVFESTWSRGTPASFLMVSGDSIDCITDQLVGQKVGSRVVLVCPPDVAFGDDGRAPDVKGGDTIIFAVDLLGAA